mgnify:CR=1 FL=1
MKDDPSLNLATRREQLRLRSAQLREQIAVRSQVFQPAFRATDRVRGGVRSVRGVRDNRTLLMLRGAALAGALLVRPRAALQLGIRAWSGWPVYRRLPPLVNLELYRGDDAEPIVLRVRGNAWDLTAAALAMSSTGHAGRIGQVAKEYGLDATGNAAYTVAAAVAFGHEGSAGPITRL